MDQTLVDGRTTAAAQPTSMGGAATSSEVEIDVAALVGSRICVAMTDGDCVYEAIHAALARGQSVVLSFQGVENLSTAFMWAAIGRFLETCSKASFMERVRVKDQDYHKRAFFDRVLRNAETFYKNPDFIRRMLKEDLGLDDDED